MKNLLLTLLMGLFLVACGSDDSDESSDSAAASTTNGSCLVEAGEMVACSDYEINGATDAFKSDCKGTWSDSLCEVDAGVEGCKTTNALGDITNWYTKATEQTISAYKGICTGDTMTWISK